MTVFSRLAVTGLAAAAAIATAVPAGATTITGGSTSVTVTSAPTLTGLGLTITNFGSSSVTSNTMNLPVATFAITGGSVNDMTGALMVQHNGSGLTFTGGGKSLSVSNFLIDTAAAKVFADAMAGKTSLGNVPLFNIGPNTSLLVTSQAAGAFTSIFGAPDLTGAQFGTAVVNAQVAAVPEPATWSMMILGFGVMGYALRRRQPSVRVSYAR